MKLDDKIGQGKLALKSVAINWEKSFCNFALLMKLDDKTGQGIQGWTK